MRLLPFLALVLALLAGGTTGDAYARDRDRDHDRRHERQERRYERDHEDRRRGDNRGRREESHGGRDEGWGDAGRGRRNEARRVDDRYFGGGRESNLVDRRAVPEGRTASRMSASQAARQAQQQYGGGRVLSVDSMGDGYRVKLLRDGDVRVVFISDD